MRIETIEINNVKYPVRIHYEQRDSARVSIGKKAVIIRIPLSLSREEQFRELLKMKVWARSKLLEEPEKFKPKEQHIYTNGEILKVGEEEFKLNISFKEKQSSSARIVGNSIYLLVSSALTKEVQNRHVSALLSRSVARRRLPKLQEKIHALNQQHFHHPLKKIFFKYNQSNWGSCSINGNINISTRLLFAPDDVLEYVCIHELAHLMEHNHSDGFWSLVEKVMPNYREKEQWLKDNGDKCNF